MKTNVAGIELNYTVSGAGPALVLMHGWGCDHTTVASIERVAAETHTVYNLDLPGFGESQEPTEVWGVPEYAQMLRQFVEQQAIDNPVLVGHSYGGRVAILYASQYPVDKLVLVDSAGVKPRRSPKYYLKVYSFKAAKRLAPIVMGRKRAEAYIERRRGRSGSQDYNNSSAKMRAVMSRSVNQDLRYAMPDIKAPTLLVWGENDTATPMRDARIMERLIPNAGLVSFAGCGHYSFLDNPIQFAAVLRCFLCS